MFAFLTPVDGAKTDPLADAQAAERFWTTLPRTDPVMAQRVMSDALADLTTAGQPTVGHVCALLALGKRARKLTEALFINYREAVPKLQPLERKYWQSAFELSQSFRHCLLELVRCNRDGAQSRDWPEYAPLVLLRYLQHRQIESLLRPYVGPRPRLLYSSEVHEVYNYLRAQGLADKPVTVRRFHETATARTTLEREYIHVLLLKVLRSAQLPPHEAFWVNRRIPGWSEELRLEASAPGEASGGGAGYFIVEPDDPDGLVRAEGDEAKPRLRIDPAPLLTRVHDELVALRDGGPRAVPATALSHERQLKLLRKVFTFLAPKQERIRRRGERKFVSTTVEAVTGLAQILRALRNEQRQEAANASTCAPAIEEITITEFGAYPETPAAYRSPDNDGPAAMFGDIGLSYNVWQIKDRSDSGCRLHGQINDGRAILPGTLIALRDGGGGPWSVAVVRRLRPLIGSHVELGLEFLGRDARVVKMSAPDPAEKWGGAAPKGGHSFSALYLPASSSQPAMPVKTVIVPAGTSVNGHCLTLASATSEFTVRLKQPIEEQAEFVWLPYEVVGPDAAMQAA